MNVWWVLGLAVAVMALRPGAVDAALTRPPGVPAAALGDAAPPAPVAWWHGFHDPALDTLMRAVAQTAPAQAAQVATLYLTTRALHARLAVAHDLMQLLARQRHWASLEGPTPQAAQALGAIGAALADIEARAATLVAQGQSAVATLREIAPLPPERLDEVLQAAAAQVTVPSFAWPAGMDGVDVAVAGLPGADALAWQAAEVQALEKSGRELGERFAAARMALDAGQASERAVLLAYERLLVEADALLQAQAGLAIGWVRVLAHGP